ncbi:MAG TPA: branched-chain amino acid ABC transporter substrate-binding protein [Actinomycetota bacterium]|nr:branched-chain amino acid ABC transporter substrate-binding protein [Actinomycetota bacterium]
MRDRRYLAILALVSALTLVAAACGDDDEGGGETTETGGTATGGAVDCEADEFGCVEIAAGAPIQLASLLSISGETAFLGEDSNNGITLAIDDLDGSLDATPGQLLGHDVELIQEDDGCSAEGGQAGATALAANPDIVAVIGTSCSSSALGVADTILGDKGILLFSPSNTNPGLTSEEAHQPFYFRTAHNDLIQGAIVAEYVFNELGIDSAATINDESPYADGLAAAFRDTFEGLGGTITAIEQVNSADTDLGPVLNSIAEGQPGAVYGPNFNPVCALTATQGQDILPEGTVQLGSDGCLESAFLETAGDLPAGYYYASSPDLTVFAEGDFYQNDFLPAYQDQFGSRPTAVFHAHAYDAANILFQAIEEVAADDGSGNLTISRTALRDAIQATADYDGVTGTITCTPLGDCATDVTIGIFEYPSWPVEGGEDPADPVYTDTKTLEDVQA